jgi:hypothetical protein
VKKFLLIGLLIAGSFAAKAQKIDSIYFHLYTDSLKKGTHNYINVDGKLSNGRWMPLTDKDIKFSSSACQFNGNELIVPPGFTDEKVTIIAELRSQPSQHIEKVIWIKTIPDPATLPSEQEVIRDMKKNKRRG